MPKKMLKRDAPSVDFPPVRRESVMEMVARRIETLVRDGRLGRGSRLPSEPRLAEMLHVSRASLREALKGMVFLGLLKARAGDGTYLQPSLSSMVSRHFQWMLLLQEIRYLELYELRQILEPAAAALAARRATREDHEQMKLALAAMRAAGKDMKAFVRAEMEFHAAITRAAKNAAIQATMQMMYSALAEGRYRVAPLVANLKQHCEHHEHIYRLITAGDSAAARRAVTEDLKYAESLLRRDLNAAERGEGSSDASVAKKAAPSPTPRRRGSRKSSSRPVKASRTKHAARA